MAKNTFAAIDIGSYELGMRIYEISGQGAIRQVDDLDGQTILVRHYLNYETFDMVADRMHYSKPTIMRKYKKALEQWILNDTAKSDMIVV